MVSTSINNGSSTETAVQTRRTPWTDRLVSGREYLLDLVTGVQSKPVLNDTAGHVDETMDSDNSADLKRFMDTVKLEAIDQQGYNVDYQYLKNSLAYLKYRQSCSPRLRKFDPALLTARQEKLAFWINLYNALIMDGVIAGGIPESVAPNYLALLGFFRNTAYEIAGMRVNADDIEHGILRGNRGHPLIPGRQFTSRDPRLSWCLDPVNERIHFALNCAGRSCPPIQVYSAEKIEQQLDLAARNFVNADLEIDLEQDAVHISAIFKWYAADFGGYQGVLDFLIEHLNDDDRKHWLEGNRDRIELKYKTYDWGLNSAKIGVTA